MRKIVSFLKSGKNFLIWITIFEIYLLILWNFFRLPYADLFGGVSAMTKEHFRLVNGFSNVFSGWGGEDDDMANRIKAHGLRISRYPANIARYKMLNHKKEKANPKRWIFPFQFNNNEDLLVLEILENILEFKKICLKSRKCPEFLNCMLEFF